MNEEKSPIQSFGVSLGSAPIPSLTAKPLEPWNVLICSDLGFKSSKPEALRISEWNEFMASKKIVLSGNVENVLENVATAFFVEYPVTSLKDISVENMLEKIKPVSGYYRVYCALRKLLVGTSGEAEALSVIESSNMPLAEKARIRPMLGKAQAATADKPRENAPRSGINSILSMVDFGGGAPEVKNGHPTQSASDALIASIASGPGSTFQKGPLEIYVNAFGEKLRDQVAAIQKQPFFASVTGSWQCLMDCGRTIGRNKEIALRVFSAPEGDMEEKFAGVLESCIEAATVPDVVLWDFGATFTNASMERLAKIAESADQCKCVVVAPLSDSDAFLEQCAKRETFAQFMQDVRYLPFKKLRDNSAGRCLSLCGPNIQFQSKGSPAANIPDMAQRACGGWALLSRWIASIIDESDPFTITDAKLQESALLSAANFDPKISRAISEEAALEGITLFHQLPGAVSFDRAVTVIDSQNAGAAYSSLGFNILVNRVARLAVMRLSVSTASKTKEDAAKDLCVFLQKELTPYHVLGSPEQVSVAVGSGGEIELTINSDVSVSGFPAQFSFSLNL
jgi:predicted component of type VI protein secretion system